MTGWKNDTNTNSLLGDAVFPYLAMNFGFFPLHHADTKTAIYENEFETLSYDVVYDINNNYNYNNNNNNNNKTEPPKKRILERNE